MPEPTVLLHGFTQTARSWDRVRRCLPMRADVLAPDLRGHGAASAARPVGFAEVAEDIATQAPARFALCGYSMGGRLALQVALAHPGRVTGLVLVSTTAGIEDAHERQARRAADERLAGQLERQGLEAFAERWAAQPLFAGLPADLAVEARADRLRNDAAGLAAALRGLGTGAMEPLWDRLPELTVPATVLAGERDAKFLAIARRLAATLADATLTTVPGAGHALHLEAPETIVSALG
ncbi:MAG TPA: 2-succinyl-6-hydroxy-2,4-cyclohexadiene-1-carboxylate synthase [Solirubrobacteraceae bacterium]|nr:2-succinyl-6-hydroxy-2,4-cyclohexadiene-1-carboxylate synthase [Solirubrobacteraceae bacterium]